MKKMLHILVSLTVLLAACTAQEEKPGAGLSLSVREVEFEGIGGDQKTVGVVSESPWYARSTESWLKVNRAAGQGGEEEKLRVSVDDNEDTAVREAIVRIRNVGGGSDSLKVIQAAGGAIHIIRGISSAQDLVDFAAAVNGNGSVAPYLVDGVVRLNNDIDVSSIHEWIPIGSRENPLIYDFDGNNKTIHGIHWSIDVEKYPSAGLIGAAEGIRIRRLTLGDGLIELAGSTTGEVRAGAVMGRAVDVTLEKVRNNADITVTATTLTGNGLIVGGLVGYLDPSSIMGGDIASTTACRNYGDITVPVVAQAGGLVGYNSGTIANCIYDATLTCPSDASCGPGWICSFTKADMAKIYGNSGAGYVGDTPAMMRNSMFNCQEGYNPETNSVDWTQEAYYDWKAVDTRQLCAGAKFTHYSCTNIPREVFVLEVDLKNPGVEIASAYAGDMIPNPNGNANNNNGFKLRERLSDLCKRKRAEGQKILAGVNAGFFDSNDGITRGFHVEDAQPMYINNPDVVSSLTNHVWAFTVFKDGTASCGKKAFSGKLRMGGEEYPFYSVNDTILRHSNADYQANLYTSRYVRQPYASKPNILNKLALNVLYVICEYDSAPMTVNTGYAPAKVVAVADGRTNALTEAPYLTDAKRVGIALSGEMAEAWSSVKPGDKVELSCEIKVEGEVKPILTQVSTMYQIMTDGKDASNTPGSSASLYTKYDPKTFPVVSRDLSKVWLVQVDGRQLWYSMGVKGYEIYRIAEKLGGWWVTVLDGGGSAVMWLFDDKGGSIVGRPADALGERSNMNYLLVREK